MLRTLADDQNTGRAPVQTLCVRGVPYANSAARFWLALLREVRADYPRCDAMALTALMDGPLQPELLFPTLALEREIQRAAAAGRHDTLAAIIAECELLGLPGGVQLELRAGAEEITRRELPRDCVDAEIFAYLLAWLLDWAEIPDAQWNAEHVSGAISAAAGETAMALRLDLSNTHLSEGLYRRRVLVEWECGAEVRAGL